MPAGGRRIARAKAARTRKDEKSENEKKEPPKITLEILDSSRQSDP